jgi:hypothetical protein
MIDHRGGNAHHAAPGRSASRRIVLGNVGLILTASLLWATQTLAAAETVGALLLRLQEESAAPFIPYCSAKAPDLKRPLETEYARFKKKFQKATAPLRTRIGANPELAKPASRDLIRQFEQMNAQSFTQAQSLEPRSFCLGLKNNLSNASEDSIQRNMQSAFAEFTAAIRQGK